MSAAQTALRPDSNPAPAPSPARLSHLKRLEAEAIHIFREVAGEFERPVILFSGGKDSIVMLRLAERAILDTVEHHAHLRLRPALAR